MQLRMRLCRLDTCSITNYCNKEGLLSTTTPLYLFLLHFKGILLHLKEQNRIEVLLKKRAAFQCMYCSHPKVNIIRPIFDFFKVSRNSGILLILSREANFIIQGTMEHTSRICR